MPERIADPSPALPPPPTRRAWPSRLAAGLVVVACVAAATGFWVMKRGNDRQQPAPGDDPAAGAKAAPPVGGVPLFTGWPRENPDLVLVLTGQTYGYLSPCGCSRPQKGGLERRANFMDSLRSKGWAVVGLDLGDAAPPKGVHKQNLLKYRYTMKALAEMGYAAVGLGEYDFSTQLFELLAEYPLNNPGRPPIILSANLVGVQRNETGKSVKEFPREQYFPGDPKDPAGRALIEGYEVVTVKGRPAFGVVGVVGPTVQAKVRKLDPQFDFAPNATVIKDALAAMAKHAANPDLFVLLYQGTMEEAQAAAVAFPQFQLILCQSEESEPPQFPTQANAGKTTIVQVGHKGQNVGVVGAFRHGVGKYTLKYQLVPLGEEYLTPAGQEKNNMVLQLLEDYTAEVKKQNFLALFTAHPLQHPAQIQHPDDKLAFVGSEKCMQCHQAEYAVWKNSKHGHAYNALETVAIKPGNRQFDGECIVCHTVGFEYQTGFRNAADTPHLKNVGCENCHGPGSGHSAAPKNPQLLAALSPWKGKAGDKLPDLKFVTDMAKKKPIDRGSVNVPPGEQQVMNAVSSMCMKCHDGENDPKFDFFEYYPKIFHSGLKANAAAGLPPGAK